MQDQHRQDGAAAETAPRVESYEAPRIEVVLDREALEREVHYAGQPTPA